MNKPLYFVTKEKTVKHIGFFTESQITLLESEESLSQQGFTKDPAFFRETDDAVYIFSSWLPQSIIALWIDQILERADLILNLKGEKEENAQKEEKIKKIEKVASMKKKPHPVYTRKPCKTIRRIELPRPPTHPKPLPKRIPRRKKTVDMLQEEIRTQRVWNPFVPVCRECIFWEKRFLQYTQTETGECTATGNLVSPQKKACSEFQKR